MNTLANINAHKVLLFAEDGAPLQRASDANDYLGDAFASEATIVVIPVKRLGSDFLKLSSGIAGEVFQKFVNYGLKCVILGDISTMLEGSKALRDFVYETNKGQSIWFVPDMDELNRRLNKSN